jgi:hypothetical protein
MRVFAQAMGEHAPGGSGADDHIVEALIRHLTSPLPWAAVFFTWMNARRVVLRLALSRRTPRHPGVNVDNINMGQQYPTTNKKSRLEA